MNPAVRAFALPDGEDTLAVEEPLEIRVEGQTAAIAMRTPGHDLDLAVGFLAAEGVIGPDDPMDDLAALAQISDNVVDARLADGAAPSRARAADRALFASSACGLCGTESAARLLRRRGRPLRRVDVDPAAIEAVRAAFEAAQVHTHATGCMHAAALYDADGRIVALREDVGRHNAVDKVIGAWLRARPDAGCEGLGLVTTSRAGFEIVQKAVMAGIGAVCTAGAPTSLAVDLARETGCTLVGWLRPGRLRRYA